MATPQENLNAAFPGAQPNDAVLDEATGEYWVYDGSIWINVGEILGAAIETTYDISPFRETVLFSSVSRISVDVQSLDFARFIEKYVTDANVIISLEVQSRPGKSVKPGARSINLLAFTPFIRQGVAVFQGAAVPINLSKFAPTIEAELGAAPKAGVSVLQIDTEPPVVETTQRQIFVNTVEVQISVGNVAIGAVQDIYFSGVTLLIQSYQESEETGPTSRFFPDLGAKGRTVRVTECTKEYYGLLDSVQAELTASSAFVGSASNWTDGIKGVFYSSTTSKFGTKSIVFPSRTSWLQASYDPSLAFGSLPFTIEAWVNFYELGLEKQWLFDNVAINNGNVELHNLSISGVPADESVTWTHGGVITTGIWHHIAITRDSLNDIRLFVNGIQVDTEKTLVNNNFVEPVCKIGAKQYRQGDPIACSLKAFVQEVRVTNLYARYTSNFTVPTAPSQGYNVIPPADVEGAPESSVVLKVTGALNSETGNPVDLSSQNSIISPLAQRNGFAAARCTYIENYFGRIKPALEINGGAFFAITQNFDLTFNKQPFCIEFWIKPTDHPGGLGIFGGFFILDGPEQTSPRLLIDWDNAINKSYNIQWGNVKGNGFALGSAFAEFGNQIKLNQWYHVAYTRDSLGEARLFLNGKMIGQPQFLHDLNTYYHWTEDGYQDFTSPLETIGVDKRAEQYYQRRFDGYVADIRITKGYARYLRDFELSNAVDGNAEFDNIGGEAVELRDNITILFQVFLPEVIATTITLVGLVEAGGGNGDLISVNLPAGTAAGDVAFAIVVTDSIAGGVSLLDANDANLGWLNVTYDTNTTYARASVFRKAFTDVPTSAEQTLKYQTALGIRYVDYDMGYYRATSDAPTFAYDNSSGCGSRWWYSDDGTTVPLGVDTGTGTVSANPFESTPCLGGLFKSNVLPDGNLDTWITTPRGSSGRIVMHAGFDTGGSCCAGAVCGDNYFPTFGLESEPLNYPTPAPGWFGETISKRPLNTYVKFTIGFVRTSWDGNAGSSTAGVKIGGNPSYLTMMGFGLTVDNASPLTFSQYRREGNDNTPVYCFVVNQAVTPETSQNCNELSLWDHDNISPQIRLESFGDGQIRYATFYYPIEDIMEDAWYNENRTLTGVRRPWYEFMPAVLVGFEGGGGGPSSRSGIGIVEATIDMGTNVDFEFTHVTGPFLYDQDGNYINNNISCSLLFKPTPILVDGNLTTFISTESPGTEGDPTQIVKAMIGAQATSNRDVNCCSSICQGPGQTWPKFFEEPSIAGSNTAKQYRILISITIVRTEVTTVGSPVNIKVGGTESGLKLITFGGIKEDNTVSLFLVDNAPYLATPSDGSSITYEFYLNQNSGGFYYSHFVDGYDGNNGVFHGIPVLEFDTTIGGGSGVGIIDCSLKITTSSSLGNNLGNPEFEENNANLHLAVVRGAGTGYNQAINSSYTDTSSVSVRADTAGIKGIEEISQPNYTYKAGTSHYVPVPWTNSKNSFLLNISMLTKNVNFGALSYDTDIYDLQTGPTISNPSATSSHKISRAVYGYINQSGATSSITQNISSTANISSLSLLVHGGIVGPHVQKYLDNVDLIDGLKEDTGYLSAMEALFLQMTIAGVSHTVPLVGLKDFSTVRTLEWGSSNVIGFDYSSNSINENVYDLFRRFNINNPSMGTGLVERYGLNYSDYSSLYGIKGNPSNRAYIEIYYKYNRAKKPDYGVLVNPYEYSFTHAIMTEPPSFEEWKGGTRMTSSTEYRGRGEAFCSSGTSCDFGYEVRFRSGSGYGIATSIYYHNPMQDAFFITPPNGGTNVYLHGEPAMPGISTHEGRAFFCPPFPDNFSRNVPPWQLIPGNFLMIGSNRGTILYEQPGFPSEYDYYYGYRSVYAGLGTQIYNTTSFSSSLCIYRPAFGYTSAGSECGGWNAMISAYLKNGRDDSHVNAYSSARLGFLSKVYEITNQNASFLTLNARMKDVMAAVEKFGQKARILSPYVELKAEAFVPEIDAATVAVIVGLTSISISTLSPLFFPVTSVQLQAYKPSLTPDPDALAYIEAVELADGQPLESEVFNSIQRFFKGCKSDGIWDAIKSSCLLMGARTLAGALVPLKGTAPTPVNFTDESDPHWPFVSFLLKGEGSTVVDVATGTPITNTGIVFTASGKFGSALRHDGLSSTDRLSFTTGRTAGLTLGTGDFTMEGWIKPNAAPITGRYNIIWESRGTGEALTDRLYADFYGNGGNTFRAVLAGTSYYSTTTLSVGTWYHFAICRYQGVSKIFINGQEEASAIDASNYANGASRPYMFNNLNTNMTNGDWSLDDFRITKFARYTSNFTPPGPILAQQFSPYDRKTGLKGDNLNNYIDSNRSNAADPQNDKHISVYVREVNPSNGCYISTTTVNTSGDSYLYQNPGIPNANVKLNQSATADVFSGIAYNFYGASRSSDTSYTRRINNTNYVTATASTTPLAENLLVFGTASSRANGRLSFYSIGESVDLELLDNRVTRLTNEIEFHLNTGLSGESYDIDTLKYVNSGYASGGSLS